MVFLSYIGALYIQSGYNIIQGWIGELLEPSVDWSCSKVRTGDRYRTALEAADLL